MRFSASILSYNSPHSELTRAIDCLQRAGITSIRIIYNGPDDTYLPTLQALVSDANVQLIRTANNGYGSGHNIALRTAIDEGMQYHLVMNADLYWHDDILSPMLSYMDSHPEVGMLTPRILNLDGSLQHSCRRLPRPFDVFVRRFTPRWLFSKSKQTYVLADCDLTRPLNVPYILGCFMLMRVDALREVGLFDERFFMYPEDIDITRRMHRNYQTLYWPEVTAIHAHRRESTTSTRMLKIHIVNMIRYFNKWGWICDAERRRFNRSIL